MFLGNRGLPAGWERAETAEGKEYFIDHNTKTTHWKLPGSETI
jgi:hypothetical protein